MKDLISGARWEEEEDKKGGGGIYQVSVALLLPPPSPRSILCPSPAQVLLELNIFFSRLYCFAFDIHSSSNFTTAQLGKVLVG